MTKLYNFIEIFKEPVISENGESLNIKKNRNSFNTT